MRASARHIIVTIGLSAVLILAIGGAYSGHHPAVAHIIR
jgi:hypothetical protein